jgi:uncharacterized protein (DUF362 family)
MRRRAFFKSLIGATGSFGMVRHGYGGKKEVLIPTSVASGAPFSRVVLATERGLSDGIRPVAEESIGNLLVRSIETLFEEKADTVWRRLFHPDDIVGLKVNCLAGKGLSTRPELVNAVCEALLQAGIKKHRIIIWDRADRDLERAGYSIERRKNRVQCFGTNQVGYTSRVYEHGYVGSQLSRIVTDHCSAIINLPVLKDHGIVGLSVGLKNFFGAINNPNKYHDNVGDPYVADVNMLTPIRSKTRLTICDAITPQYEGGPPYMPQWTWPMNSLLVSTDMVAMDQVGWDIVEEKRRENEFSSLARAGREPVYINTAADAEHRLGTNNSAKIKLLKV